jgi:hypothetical protein
MSAAFLVTATLAAGQVGGAVIHRRCAIRSFNRANGDGASEPTATGRRSTDNAIAERAGLNKLAMHRRKVVPVDPSRRAAL